MMRLCGVLIAVTVAVLAFLATPAAAATRAVVVGIDAYLNVKPLKGAVADARDIAGALRARGVPPEHLRLLTDEQATRANILAAIDEALAVLKSGDLFILTFAGHGASERWGTVRPPGIAEGEPRTSFILASAIIPNAIGDIDRQLRGSGEERIIGTELNARLARFEQKKIRVLWLADTCHGGGLTRQVTVAPGMVPTTYRNIPPFRYRDGQDPLESVYRSLPRPVNPETDLARLTFLAAVDRQSRSPEVPIPAGSSAMRGALSYAFARVLDGTARVGTSPALTRRDLFGYLKPSIRQLTDNQQLPDLKPLAGFEEVVIDLEADFPGPRPAGAAPAPVQPASVDPSAVVTLYGLAPSALPPGRPGVVVRAAASAAEADLVIDRQRVLRRNGDVLAAAFTPADIPGMAEREVAVRRLQALAVRRPRDLRLRDGDRHYRWRETVEFIAEGGAGPSGPGAIPSSGATGHGAGGGDHFLFFNIASNGVVQHLLPVGRGGEAATARLVADQSLAVVCVTKPFGADLAVLVTSAAPLTDLIDAMVAADGRPEAIEVVARLEAAWSTGITIGLQGLYTLAEDARDKAHPRCP